MSNYEKMMMLADNMGYMAKQYEHKKDRRQISREKQRRINRLVNAVLAIADEINEMMY